MNVGDVVQLKSGGPLLTVADITNMQPSPLAVFTEPTVFVGTVECWWFTTKGDLCQSNFPVDVLVPHVP